MTQVAPFPPVGAVAATPPIPPAPVFLCGLPGSGKSTVAPLLAARLGYRAVDSDQELERRSGRSVVGWFAAEGEAGFRGAERRVVADLSRRQRVVVALGGGALEDPATRGRLRRRGRCLWLDAPLPELVRRCAGGPRRPLLDRDPAARLAELAARRLPVFAALALRVETGGRLPAEVAAACARALTLAPAPGAR